MDDMLHIRQAGANVVSVVICNLDIVSLPVLPAKTHPPKGI